MANFNVTKKSDSIVFFIFKKEEKIELRELTLLGFDKSSAYIAVLFLMVKDDIDIVQEDFYGKLYVKKAQKSAEEEVAN